MSVCGTFVLHKLIVLWSGASPLLAQPTEHIVEIFVVFVQESDFSILSVLRVFRDVVGWRLTLRSGERETVVCRDRVLLNPFSARGLNLQLDSTTDSSATDDAREASNHVAVKTDELVFGAKRVVVREPKRDLGAIKLDVRSELVVLFDHFAERRSESVAFVAQRVRVEIFLATHLPAEVPALAF